MNRSNSYWSNISQSFATLSKGLYLTLKHLVKIGRTSQSADRFNIQSQNYFRLQKGVSTIQFPHEQLPIPETGRYQLHNEIDDCIVCDKCVKVCPVNCITIEPVRSPEEFGKTSDGTSRRIYAAKFDIDMGKCCFCGLCTTVCPTECLTMTSVFDFSTFNMKSHYFKFGNMTEHEIAEKKEIWLKHQELKPTTAINNPANKPSGNKPVFKPKINIPKPPSTNEQ